MANRLKKILKDMRVSEISLVGEGDNPGSDVLILKMRDAVHIPTDTVMNQFGDLAETVASLYELAAGRQGDEGVSQASAILKGLGMTIEELQAKLETVEATVETITKERDDAVARADKAEGELTTAQGSLDTVTKERDTLKAAAPTKDEDDVLKGLPESIRKRLDDADKVAKEAQEEVTKLREAGERAEFVAKARDLGLAKDQVDPMGELLHRVAKGQTKPEDADRVVEVLTIAKNVGDAGSKLFEAIGKTREGEASDGSEAQAKLDAFIVDIQKAKPELSYAAAYDQALMAHPELYEEVKKVRPKAA